MLLTGYHIKATLQSLLLQVLAVGELVLVNLTAGSRCIRLQAACLDPLPRQDAKVNPNYSHDKHNVELACIQQACLEPALLLLPRSLL
jgi:hypothetical protein